MICTNSLRLMICDDDLSGMVTSCSDGGVCCYTRLAGFQTAQVCPLLPSYSLPHNTIVLGATERTARGMGSKSRQVRL